MTAATELESLLTKGIGAYKQGDYATAERILTQLRQSKSGTYRLKASMGLTRLYIAQQKWTEAQTLCQKIGASSKPSLQEWASKTSAKIERRMAESALNQNAPAPKTFTAPAKKGSGFQPLNPDLDTVTTNVPPKVPSKTTRPHYTSVHLGSDVATDDVSEKGMSGKDSSEKEVFDQDMSENGVSLFHYAYLNGEEADADSMPNSSIDAPLPAGDGFIWPYAGRLNQGRSIGKVKKTALLAPQLFGAIAFYFLLRFLLQHTVTGVNNGLNWLTNWLPVDSLTLPYAFYDLTWPLLVALILLTAASPWLWDLFLILAARKPLSISQLRSHSAESAKIINWYCRKRRWPFPKLWKLPTDIPVIFSYGCLPRTARLVISQGLLAELKEDEVAALVAYEMSQWKSWYWPLLSVQGLISQGLLQLYWWLSLWANRQATPVKWAVGSVATALYVLFWLLRLPGLWIARSRTYYGDRAATEITGNPNALIRGLSKLSFAIAANIQQQGHTPVLIEALVPQLPVNADLARHRLYGQLPLAQLFSWDSTNPVRQWMSCADAHPPLGDRLRVISAYAQHWKLTPEITFPTTKRRQKGLSAQDWQQLLRQATPFIGLALGIAIGLTLWLLGAVGVFFKLPALDWMHKDMNLLQGCMLLGISIGTVLRINRFFPDLLPSMPWSSAMSDWLSDATLLPANSLPTKLKGTLLGRPGVANWLGQDLMLNADFGLLKLHFLSVLGPIGNAWNRSARPINSKGNTVQIIGWFRRGNQPWLDIDQLRLVSAANSSNRAQKKNAKKRLAQAAHPLFSLLVAAIGCALGLWSMLGQPSF